MKCKKTVNVQNCICSYEPCSRKYLCCECILHHRKLRQLPACFFPKEIEQTYNRSFEQFAKLIEEHLI